MSSLSLSSINMSSPTYLSSSQALYTDCNFEVAQELLKECSTLLDNDFFLSNSEQDFMTHARLYISSTKGPG